MFLPTVRLNTRSHRLTRYTIYSLSFIIAPSESSVPMKKRFTTNRLTTFRINKFVSIDNPTLSSWKHLRQLHLEAINIEIRPNFCCIKRIKSICSFGYTRNGIINRNLSSPEDWEFHRQFAILEKMYLSLPLYTSQEVFTFFVFGFFSCE